MKTVLHFVRTNIFSGLESTVINICTLVSEYHHYYVSPNGPINDYLTQNKVAHIAINKLTPWSVRKIIKDYQPDIVQGHDVVASLCLATNFHYCRKHNIKIVSQLHSDDPRMTKLTPRSLLYALSCFTYDTVIGVSQAVLSENKFKRRYQDKFVVVSNVINEQEIKRELQLSPLNRSWDCIFIGRLVEEKDPLKFVRIVASLKQVIPNIQAAILGSGQLKPKVEAAIKQAGLSVNVSVLGFQKQRYRYLNSAKILVMPSNYEGFGLVAVEALLLGKPVVAARVGGLAQLVDRSCGSIVQTEAEFVAAIKKLLLNADLYEQKAQAAVRRGQEINQIEQFISAYQTIYQLSQGEG